MRSLFLYLPCSNRLAGSSVYCIAIEQRYIETIETHRYIDSQGGIGSELQILAAKTILSPKQRTEKTLKQRCIQTDTQTVTGLKKGQDILRDFEVVARRNNFVRVTMQTFYDMMNFVQMFEEVFGSNSIISIIWFHYRARHHALKPSGTSHSLTKSPHSICMVESS